VRASGTGALHAGCLGLPLMADRIGSAAVNFESEFW